MPFWKKKIHAAPLIDLEPANAHQIGVRTLVVCPVAGCEHCTIMPALWEKYWGDPSGELLCPIHDEFLVDVRSFIGPFSRRIAALMLDPTINPPPDLIARVTQVDPTVIPQFLHIWKFLMFYVRGAEKWAWLYGNWDFNTPAKSPSEDEKAEKLYTFTAVPRGKGLKHEGRNRYEVYREEQDWIARYLLNFEKKIGSYLPDGFKWQNIMTHFHKIGEWAPERWNMINPPAARLGRLSSFVVDEIARWLNERINAIGWGIKRLIVLKSIPEDDLLTQKSILDWYCIGQTCALFLNYEARVWNWLDPQLFIRNDKRPIPLDVAHTLLTEPAKGHLAMRIDPIILLQYYSKFVDVGLTESNAEQAKVRFDQNGGSIVSAYVTKEEFKRVKIKTPKQTPTNDSSPNSPSQANPSPIDSVKNKPNKEKDPRIWFDNFKDSSKIQNLPLKIPISIIEKQEKSKYHKCPQISKSATSNPPIISIAPDSQSANIPN